MKTLSRFLPFLLLLAAGNASHARPPRPNILFAIMDDATYRHMGAYGCSWVKTPNFDRVARQGLLFTRAYTPNAKCAPSRSCIITGRNPWQLEAAANHWSYFPSNYKTLAEALSDKGYAVGYSGKGVAPVVARTAAGAPRELLVKAYNGARTTPPTSGISVIDYAANFDTFLNGAAGQQPFFFWYGGLEPHRGYEYGSGIAKGNKRLEDIPASDLPASWPKSDSVTTDLLDYAFEIEYFDAQLGKMLASLEKRGLLENTLVIVTSDNGMAFPRVKGQEYEYSSHLPLAVMWADGIRHPGREVNHLISFIDFAPTILEVAGIPATAAGMQPLTGSSFAGILFSSGGQAEGYTPRTHVLIGKERHDVGRPHDAGYPIRGMVTDSLLYLHNFETGRWPAGNPETGYLNCDGGPTKTVVLQTVFSAGDDARYWLWSFGKRPAEELYNIARDPECLRNLAADPRQNQPLPQLKATLFSMLQQQRDPRMAGNGKVFDAYPYADKSGTGFYERYLQKDTTLKWKWVNDADFQQLPALKREMVNR
ncbi:sulfatase family protein [Chitinophaga alhagiae]|uniref:sulfatase family protein n=1 Tax=Chitinophaga alhagiae TaxID=2203219 RepID=UPI000E5A9157|nr:sulfatase [Chitinophaga alhagiae]